ncbi:MAG: hypothetical protein ACK4I0_10995 [Brevundimonas sp.]|uniref:hypothetical protein n=1 Tax=Brevundimonas sp. TaxID=1871086 RepID=UPI00391AED21
MRQIQAWASIAENSVSLSIWSFYLGIAGLFASVIGFSITLWQLVRTASAAKAATLAVTGIKSKFAAYDTLTEMTKASSSLKETLKHLKNAAWPDAIDSYSAAMSSTVRVAELSNDLTESERDSLGSVTEGIKRSSNRLETAKSKNIERFDGSKESALIRSHMTILTQITVSVERVL